MENEAGGEVGKRRKSFLKTLSRVFIVLIVCSSVVYGQLLTEIPSHYEPLFQRLAGEGFDSEYLSQLFTDPRAELIPHVMTISLALYEVPERYAQFLNPESILLAKKFLDENRKTMREMESRFQVDKEVIAAILLVESRFGQNIGRYRVLPTLASMALMDSPENLRKNFSTLRELDPELSYEWMEGRAKRRARWAYQELKCFLTIIRYEEVDPLEVYGSSAGALGMAQFIPSSYLTYALNQSTFETWLLSKDEAIFSIGNYLKSHGWKKNLPAEKKKRILWAYNRSEPYVTTVLQVAEKISPNRGRNRSSKN
jgi:membrane-bound lytic murein transglycosylase B